MVMFVLPSLFALCSWGLSITDDDDDAWKKNNLINVSALSLTTAAAAYSTLALTLLLWPTKSSRTLNQMWASKCRYSLSIVEYPTSPINLLFNLYSLSLYEERPHNEFYEYCGVVLNQKMFWEWKEM